MPDNHGHGRIVLPHFERLWQRRGHYQVEIHPGEFGGMNGRVRRVGPGDALFDDDVFPVHVSKLAQLLLESRDQRRHRAAQKADAPGPGRAAPLLRERRQRERATE